MINQLITKKISIMRVILSTSTFIHDIYLNVHLNHSYWFIYIYIMSIEHLEVTNPSRTPLSCPGVFEHYIESPCIDLVCEVLAVCS